MLLSKFVQNIEFGKAHFLERVIGIEPTSSAWKADALTVVLYPHNAFLGSNKREG